MADFNFDGKDNAQDLISFQMEGHKVIDAAEAIGADDVVMAQKVFLNKSIYALRNAFIPGVADITAAPYPEADGYPLEVAADPVPIKSEPDKLTPEA